MKIIGVEGLSVDQLNNELSNGAKFVVYQYCISILVMTFKRSSDIYFIRSRESSGVKGISFTLLSALVGWWGFPWGPIYTIMVIVNNCNGGKDVTQQVLESFNSQPA